MSLHWPQAVVAADGAVGEVLYVDSFGNLISNLTSRDLAALGDPADLVVECADWTIARISRTYEDARPGQLVALFDSQGRLELAACRGQAASLLHARTGAEVRVRRVI